MSDLGPLLAAVTDEWERGKTIAKRAGVTGREATAGLGVLVRRGDIDSQLDPTETFALYRRGPKAPPLAVQVGHLPLRDLIAEGDDAEAIAHHYLQATEWSKHEDDDAPGIRAIRRRRALCRRIIEATA